MVSRNSSKGIRPTVWFTVATVLVLSLVYFFRPQSGTTRESAARVDQPASSDASEERPPHSSDPPEWTVLKVEPLHNPPGTQIYLTTRLVEMDRTLLEELELELGGASTWTERQRQLVIRALSQKKGVNIASTPSVVTLSEQAAQVEVGEVLLKYQPKISDEHGTIEMNYSFGEESAASKMVVRDGDTAVAKYPTDDPNRVVLAFVTQRNIDPAGVPVRSREQLADPPGQPVPSAVLAP